MSPTLRLTMYELRPLLRGAGMRLAWVLLILAGLLSIAQGHRQIDNQRAQLNQLPAIHEADIAALKQRFAEGTDSGSMAYYLFLPTGHAPAGWADLAVGLRDSVPVAMKIRMLGLYSQLFDAELVNPRLAAAGGYDFAFFVLLIMPLWLLLLGHGVLARDEEVGTGGLLRAQAASLWKLLLLRITLRWLLTWLLCGLLLGAALLGTAAEADWRVTAAMLSIGLYLGFWAALCAAVVALRRSSLWSATVLLGLWALLVLVLPQGLAAWNERLHPVDDAAAIVLKQREVMHTGWDLPKEVSFERFFQTHPEWQDTPPVTERFHWKWYFAMHQVADDSVRQDVAAYRSQLQARDRFTAMAAILVPSIGLQRSFTGMAGTDLIDHLAYLESIERYHDTLRGYFYPKIFQPAPEHFDDAAYDQVPRHTLHRAQGRWNGPALLGMAAWILALLLAARQLLTRNERRRATISPIPAPL
jgi:ABC-2 type transport system permease protein